MDLLEIVMLIIGVITIILSCWIVARPDKNQNTIPQYSQEELNSYMEQQNEILASVSEETISKTDDYLSKLSNEKIMVVSEYSEQILEKISRNHEEVIFLYHMLVHKEKELKNMQLNINGTNNLEKVESDKETANFKQMGDQAEKIKTIQTGESIGMSLEVDEEQSNISFDNTEILKLDKQGKSVLDIAKELGIGQGEVKLVIDLFKDK